MKTAMPVYFFMNECAYTLQHRFKTVIHARALLHKKTSPNSGKGKLHFRVYARLCMCFVVQSLLPSSCDLVPECGSNSTEGRVHVKHAVTSCSYLTSTQYTGSMQHTQTNKLIRVDFRTKS